MAKTQKWTKQQVRSMICSGRRDLPSHELSVDREIENFDKAHAFVVRAIQVLAELTKAGRDGEGFAAKSVGGKGDKLARVAYWARTTGKLYGQPGRDAAELCWKHAGQLAKVANGKIANPLA